MPVRVWHNLRAKNWRLIDNTDTIIADNLTKELVETLEQAVNLCPSALEFTKFFVEWEGVVGYPPGTQPNDIVYRNAVYDEALKFMIELGLIEPPPKFIDAFPAWRDELMDNFYKVVNKWD